MHLWDDRTPQQSDAFYVDETEGWRIPDPVHPDLHLWRKQQAEIVAAERRDVRRARASHVAAGIGFIGLVGAVVILLAGVVWWLWSRRG